MKETQLIMKLRLILLSYIFLSSPSLGQDAKNNTQHLNHSEDSIIVPQSIKDPLEPVNRRVWIFNTLLNKHLMHPLGKGYRFIIRKPMREKINNFSHNLYFPKRFINLVLQGQWSNARQETHRFAINSTLGGIGLFDPASSFNITSSEADFGQTLGRWGWDPSLYVIIPILGPSNERDAIGLTADTALNPAFWVSSPYLYGTYGFAFNEIVDLTGEFDRFNDSIPDAYASARQVSSILRKNDIDNFRITKIPKDNGGSLLSSIFSTPRDIKFSEQMKTRSVRLPSTGKRFKYSVCLQSGSKGAQAPIVYLLSGLGGHRLSLQSLARAEMIFSQGYSVVSLGGVFNTEFIKSAATAAVPGYTKIDNQDLHAALDAIDRSLTSKYGNRIGKRALFGVSVGAFHTMMIAASCESEKNPLIHFDRYIAAYPPIDLLHGLKALDHLYDSALNWPPEKRSEKIDNAFRKVGYVIKASDNQPKSNKATPSAALPFDRNEAQFLVGYAYRTILRDIIFASQRQKNLAVLKQPIRKFRRAAVYEEINHYNFNSYLNSFVIPYYQSGQSGKIISKGEIARAANLKNLAASLRRVPDLRIISSQDDFLLKPSDIRWMRSLVSDEKIKIFTQGGHLGQLSTKSGITAMLQSINAL